MPRETPYWAHVGKFPAEGHGLKEHLLAVGRRAAEFAAAFQAREWGESAGLWHDLGKYSSEFQHYLQIPTDASAETSPGHVDHSTAGAQHAARRIPILGHLLSYAIAGHHAGLLDGRSEEAAQEKRLKKPCAVWEHGLAELPDPPDLQPPDFLRAAFGKKDAFAIAFFVRMLFSCLVDADFLDTERAMNPEKFETRPRFPSLGTLAASFFQSLEKMEHKAGTEDINAVRHQIRRDCEHAADQPPGFFSLTVPTGGGKTLSSMAFALRHALRHDLRRVVYVAPFTTIIEQNAGVFREHLGREVVLEHHCNLDPEKESEAARLASENWDAPVIVTTSVQFYESLFANKPSRCRKLHRIARSVIVLDEAQTLPVNYLKPCHRALELLVRDYGCTVLLCTATQPEIRRRPGFEIGLEGVREIMPDPAKLYHSLERVEVARLGLQNDAQLRERILAEKQALCIVNTTRHARLLFDAIGPAPGHFHLSARMCPAHRHLRLWQIRRALKSGAVCRVISTQVVEAGVDLDFPVVYRAMAGLDSIAQAAGRCNRRNKLGRPGGVYIFTSEHASANRYFADTAQCAAQVLEIHADPLSLEANERFFRLYYWDQKARWDAHHILENFHLEQNRDFPFNFSFETAARNFHLIDDASECAVLIPWGRKDRTLCQRLRAMSAPDRETLRQAQRLAVRVFPAEWARHAGRDIKLIYDNLGILESPQTHYDAHTGLNLEAEGPGMYLTRIIHERPWK